MCTSPNHPPVSRKGISQPHPHDVLCGSGGAASNDNHFGNTVFIDIVLRNKHLFQTSPDHHKAAVAKGIVDAIRRQDPPGRFVALNRKEGLWYEIENRQAIGKTNKALREAKGDVPAVISPILEPKARFTTAAVPLKPPSGGDGMGAAVTSLGNKRNRDGNAASNNQALSKKIKSDPGTYKPASRAVLPIFRPPQAQQPRVNKPLDNFPAPANAPQQQNVNFEHEPFHHINAPPLHNGVRRSNVIPTDDEQHRRSSGFLPRDPLDHEMEQKLMQEYDDRIARESFSPAVVGGGAESRVSLVRTETFPPPELVLPRSSLKTDVSMFGEPGVSAAAGGRRSSRFSLTMPFGLGSRLSKLFHEPLPPDDGDHQFDDPVEGPLENAVSPLKSEGRKERQMSLFEDDDENEQIERLRCLHDPSKPNSGRIPAQHHVNWSTTSPTFSPKVENQPASTATTVNDPESTNVNDPELEPPELQTQVSLKREISDFFLNLNPTSILRGISLTGQKTEEQQQQHDLETADEEELDDAFLSHSEKKRKRDQKIRLLSERSYDEDEIEKIAQAATSSPSRVNEPGRASGERRWSISSSFLGGSRRVSKLFGAFASIEPPAVDDVGAV